MVIVTDKEYMIEPALKEKCDIMLNRVKHNNDNLLIFQGDEGSGKSTMVMGIAYYFAYSMGKPFTVNNVFFDLDKMLDFAQKTTNQVIVWDEAALGGMGIEWQNKAQKKLIKMLMVARKKNHCFFFVIPKFHKLNEYIAVDRAIGLVHVYAIDGIDRGQFVYFDRAKKDKLYYQMKKTNFRNYKQFSFKGRYSKKGFVIDENEYDKKKDQAILDMFKEEEDQKSVELKGIKSCCGEVLINLSEPDRKMMCEVFGNPYGTIKNWNSKYKTYKSLRRREQNPEFEPSIVNYGSKGGFVSPQDTYNKQNQVQNDSD